MTKDSNKKPSGEQNEKKHDEQNRQQVTESAKSQTGGSAAHENALDAISKKVDEKLSQLANKSFDEEMERHLAEIQELRRKEKEELERGRKERRPRHQTSRTSTRPESDSSQPTVKTDEPVKWDTIVDILENDRKEKPRRHESRGAAKRAENVRDIEPMDRADRAKKAAGVGKSPKEEQASRAEEQENREARENPAQYEQEPEKKRRDWKSMFKRTKEQPQEKEEEEKHISIAEMAARAVAEAEEEKQRVAAAREAAMAELARKKEQEAAAVVERERARLEAEKAARLLTEEERASRQLTEEERMARAVDQFFDTAEEIAAAEETESVFSRLKRWFDSFASKDQGKKGKHDSGRGPKPPTSAGMTDGNDERCGSVQTHGKSSEDSNGAEGTANTESAKNTEGIKSMERAEDARKRHAEEKKDDQSQELHPETVTVLPLDDSNTRREKIRHKSVELDQAGNWSVAERSGKPGCQHISEALDKTAVQDILESSGEPVDQYLSESQGELGEQGDLPSRKLDESIDGFFGGVKLCFSETAKITQELHQTRKNMAEESHLTHEKKMARYRAVWAQHLAPITNRIVFFTDWLLIKGAQFSGWCGGKREELTVRSSLFGARARVWLKYAYSKSLVILDYMERHKMKLFRWFAGAVVCAGLIGLVIGNMTAYEYMYNGRVLGVVKDQEIVYKTIDVIGNKLSESLGADVEIDKERDITFKKIIGFQLAIDSKDDVLNSLTYMRSLKAKGYAIVADGKQVAILQSKKTAQALLDSLKTRFSQEKEGVEYKSVTYAQDVKVKEIDTELGNIQNTDDAMEYLMTGAVEKKVHAVQKGQTFNAIAKSYGMTPSELQASNPQVQPDKLKIDQELVLTQDAPVLTVQTKEIDTYLADIPYEIVYEDTSSKYKGEKTVKLQGQNGQKEVVAEIVRSNGVEVSRTEISSKVIAEPVKQVVLVGTKEKPRTVATNSFAYPVRGARLSSRYGRRWGRTHQGIDLAIAKGTTITAADGGTVTFSGYKGSYGYLVIIDHGNGKETYYAHCSKLLVSRGAKVYKGQTIAKVGSTGNSTGPHVHFEIHVNGVPKNPLNYL